MKVPLKLKKDELLCLVEFLEATILTETNTDRLEAIVNTLMVKFYILLKKKSIAVLKPQLTVNIEPEMAMAFVEFFTGYPIESFSLAGNTVNKLLANCDQQTANFF